MLQRRHRAVAFGHKSLGLSTKLDGTEDYLLEGTAKKVFADCAMAARRQQTIDEVRAGLAAGTLAWDAFQTC